MSKIYIFTILSLSISLISCSPLNLFTEDITEITDKQCRRCMALGDEIQHVLQQPQSPECVAALFTGLCLKLGIFTSDICTGMASEYSASIEYALQYNILNPYDFCGTFFGESCSNGSIIADWHVTIPGNKPPVQTPTMSPPNTKTYRVAHISDIHYDKYYQPGTEGNCNEPLCCRNQFGPGEKVVAGYWGMPAKCDMPLRTIRNLFDHLKNNETWDWMLWTGDMPPHDIWNQTKAGQIDVLDTVYGSLYEFMWNKHVYLTVGNHESAPMDSFPPRHPNVPPEDSVQWLYDQLAYNWSHWVSDVGGTQKDIKHWLYANQTDPDGSLAWLVKQLQAAENAGDKVHIIGHVPPGDNSCLRMWSANYYDIINRYENTVVGQFFGHTHSDQFIMFYENGNFSGRPTNVMYVAPSVTTFSWRMPTYRVYTVDSISFEVLETETYMLNLTDANLTNKTEWKLEYKATEAYNLQSLYPSDWNNLLQRFIQNETFFDETYSRYFDRNDNQCDQKCYFTRLCEIRSGRSHDKEDLCFDIPGYENKTRDSLRDFEIEKIDESVFFEIPVQCKSTQTSTVADTTTSPKGQMSTSTPNVNTTQTTTTTTPNVNITQTPNVNITQTPNVNTTQTTTTTTPKVNITQTTTTTTPKVNITQTMTTTTPNVNTNETTTTTKGANKVSNYNFVIYLFITVLLLSILKN